MALRPFDGLKQYMPSPYYDGIKETDAFLTAEENLWAQGLADLQTEWQNHFVDLADAEGIARMESLYGILADPSTETLDFRRERLKNRMSLLPPFSLPVLAEKLADIFGDTSKLTTSYDSTNKIRTVQGDKFSVAVNYDGQTITVESVAATGAWAQEIDITITQFKPANMVFVSKPLLTASMLLSESITQAQLITNYKLGVSWFLSSSVPFVSMSGKETIKVPSTKSIEDQLLAYAAASVADAVAKVRVNGSYEITSFTTRSSSQNTAIIEYTIPASAALGNVTKLELLDASDVTLTSADVYIGANYDIDITHTVTAVEGV
jgi:hypothetical protein